MRSLKLILRYKSANFCKHFFVFSSFHTLCKIAITHVWFDLVEIQNMYWGSKGKYQYQIWSKSHQHSMSDKWFTCIAKSNFCQAYTVNHFEEQAKNWVIHQKSAFWRLQSNRIRDNRDLKLNPTLCNQFCTIKNQAFPPISHKLQRGMS